MDARDGKWGRFVVVGYLALAFAATLAGSAWVYLSNLERNRNLLVDEGFETTESLRLIITAVAFDGAISFVSIFSVVLLTSYVVMFVRKRWLNFRQVARTTFLVSLGLTLLSVAVHILN